MRYLSAILLFGLLYSCDSPPKEKLRPQSIAYELDTLNRVYPEDSSFHWLEMNIVDLKLISNGDSLIENIADTIHQQLILNNLNSDLNPNSYEGLFEGLSTEINQLLAEGTSFLVPWRIEQSVHVDLNHNGLFGYHSFHGSFTGGAHGNTFSDAGLYRLRDGARLSIDSLLSPGSKAELLLIAEGAFRQNYGLGETASFEEQGFWFEDDVFRLAETFTYDTTGLHFHYNTYEIAPYAKGSFYIDLPYDYILPLLKPEYHLERASGSEIES
jgi:hypothetical protein